MTRGYPDQLALLRTLQLPQVIIHLRRPSSVTPTTAHSPPAKAVRVNAETLSLRSSGPPALMPPLRVERRPTMSLMTDKLPDSPRIDGYVAAERRAVRAPSSDGFVSQLSGSPGSAHDRTFPSKFRGTQKTQLPSAFCALPSHRRELGHQASLACRSTNNQSNSALRTLTSLSFQRERRGGNHTSRDEHVLVSESIARWRRSQCRPFDPFDPGYLLRVRIPPPGPLLPCLTMPAPRSTNLLSRNIR